MRSAWCLLVVLAVGCGGKKDDQPRAGSGAPAAAPIVEIFLGDGSVAKVDRAQVAGWPRLDTLVPVDARRLGKWLTVSLVGAKPTELQTPSSTYPDMVPAVFPDGDGAAFGMFDPVELVKHGKPAMRVDGVREIRIKLAENNGRGEHESGQGGGGDPTKLVLTIKTKQGDHVLTGDKLIANVPRVPMPGTPDSQGWPLTTLMTAAGVTDFKRLLLTDEGGTNLTLDHKDFDDKTVIPFVKLNKQNALRFRVLTKQGDGWQATGDLRALSTIEVTE